MFVVLGATGHIGNAVAETLLGQGESVTAVVHDAAHAFGLEQLGAEIVETDVRNTDALREVFRTGQRAFLLNPPARTDTDTDVEELRTARSVVAAIEGSGLEKIVAASTYGARPGERIGDLSVLFEFERLLSQQAIPVTVQRGAYYMSNWDQLLDAARSGVLPTMYPSNMLIPMVAPRDLGQAAARRLREPPSNYEVACVEGPERYSPQDVADAFASALGSRVAVKVRPREQWTDAFRKLGFSQAAADSFARMTAVSVDGGFDMPTSPERGSISIKEYVTALVAGQASR